MKKIQIAHLAVGAALVAMVIGCGASTSDPTPAVSEKTTTWTTVTEKPTATPTKAPPPVSVEQQNAAKDAQGYIDMQGFSRKGLIDQLSSDAGDGYTVKAATAAVDSLHIDWNAQAARAAKGYLSMQAFSRKGLISQLESDAGDGFTHAQAVYGADHAGL